MDARSAEPSRTRKRLTRQHPGVTFVAVALGVLLMSAVLAPLLHDVLPYPFERIFKRLLTLGALVGVVVFVRIQRETFVRFGMAWDRDSPRFLLTGFVVGLLGLLAMVAANLALGNAYLAIRPFHWLKWVQTIAGGVLTGVLVATLEEFLFRGFVFTNVRDRCFRGRVLPSMVTTSLLYAALHFLTIRKPTISADPGIADSIRMILAPVQSLADWPMLWPGAVGLFLFGMILNGCVVRTGSLYPSIGLHAGCVTFLRLVVYIVGFERTGELVWGTKRVYDSAVGWGFLLLVGLLLAALLRSGSRAGREAAACGAP